MKSFGQSAPAEALFKHYGFTVDNVFETAQRMLKQ
jgi:transketolase